MRKRRTGRRLPIRLWGPALVSRPTDLHVQVFTLTMDDLTTALQDKGISIAKPAYYIGSVADLAPK